MTAKLRGPKGWPRWSIRLKSGSARRGREIGSGRELDRRGGVPPKKCGARARGAGDENERQDPEFGLRCHAPIIPHGARSETVGAAIERCARALARARVHFGHGTDNARDEAAEIVFYAAGLRTKGSAAYGKLLDARRARAHR